MKNRSIALALVASIGIFSSVSASTPQPLPTEKKILPSMCNIAKGSKRNGYHLKCIKVLPNKLPFWKYEGTDTVPLEKDKMLERRIWTFKDWILREHVYCTPTGCHEPDIMMIYGDHCGAP